jgi:hypothetical protein
VRQTLGFGGEQESVESAYGQMAQKRDVSRLTVQVENSPSMTSSTTTPTPWTRAPIS